MLIKISIINYLNTLPFVYGLRNHPIFKKLDFRYSTPSQSAEDLSLGKTMLGIIPSATIPNFGAENILSNYCIGANEKVASVLLCSNLPVEEITRVYLDSHSRTSVLLASILLKKHWKREVMFSPFIFENEPINKENSYVLIGDKALKHGAQFKYVYDLATAWKEFTCKPFVFACWTSRIKMDESFIKEFDEAIGYGVNNIERAVKEMEHHFDKEYAIEYLTNNISYQLTPDKREGLSQFWTLAKEELESKVRWFG